MLQDFKTIIAALGLTNDQAADFFGIPYSTACKWAAGRKPMENRRLFDEAIRWVAVIDETADDFIANPDNLVITKRLPGVLIPAARRRIFEKTAVAAARRRAA